MSTPSVKSKWQTEIVRSELGAGPVGVGMVMSTYANVDGTGVHPSMETVAKGMGCSRGYVERHCAALVEHGKLTFVAKAIPRRRGAEYRLSVGAETLLQSEAESVPATLLQSGTNSAPIGTNSAPIGINSAPTASITMRSTMPLNHERHHECTGVGEHAWCGVEAEAKAAADAKAKDALAAAPDFD
jgi:hypothetical protein